MNYYNKNLQLLRRSNPALYQLITAATPVYRADTTILPAAHNAFVKTELGQCYLHSRYDREREWKKLLAETNPDTQALILFGLGMGDSLPHIAGKFALLERLIVIEPNIDVFRAFLTRVNLAGTFASGLKVTFILNQPADSTRAYLHELIRRELYSAVAIVASISYRTLYRDYYQAVHTISLDAVRYTLVNLATRRFSLRKWLRNEWHNQRIPRIELETVMRAIPPLPVVIVSAGPSLNKNIHLLAEAKERALVIAVGSAITILETHGIVPHFRMAYDGNEACQNVFAVIDSTKCPLIYGNTLYDKVLPDYKGKKIRMVLDSDRLTQYLGKKRQKNSTLIRSGPSVANVAFDLAGQWGCPKVILVGQDLCYSGDRVHAPGAWDEKDRPCIDKNALIKVKDMNQRDVYTSRAFLGMKTCFEELIRIHANVECINASEGGLTISGSQNKTLRQALDEDVPGRLNISALIDRVLDEISGTEYADAVETNVVENTVSELEDILRINAAQIDALRKVSAMKERKIRTDKILNELQKICTRWEKFYHIDYYTAMIHPFLLDTVQVLQRRFGYSGAEKDKKIESLLQIYSGKATALQELAQFNKMLIAEYKDTKADVFV